MKLGLGICLSIALVTGCGTTVPLAEQGAPGATAKSSAGAAPAASGLSVPAPAPSGPAPTGSQAGAGAAGSIGSAQAQSLDGTPGVSGPSTAANPSAAATDTASAEPGHAKPSPVEVGFIVEPSDTAVAGSLGLSGVDNGDEQAYADAIVAAVNKSGGLGGHPVAPVYYKLNPESSSDYSTLEQAACSTFTQDHHAFVGLTAFHNTPDQTFAACMENHGAATVDPTGYSAGGRADYQRFPDYYTPDGLEIDRQAEAYAAGLAGQGFFVPGQRVGLLSEDTPSIQNAIGGSLIPALRRSGVSLYAQETYSYPAATSDIGATANQIAAAELKFDADGIQRVLFLEDGALGAFEFMRAASSQHYYPHFGLSTTDAPDGLIGLGAPADELVNSVGIGWMPISDVGPTQEGTPPPGQAPCLAVMAGAKIVITSSTAEMVALEYCEELWFVQQAIDASRQTPSREAIRAGVAALGTGFASPETWSTTFGSQRHYGVAEYRGLAYQSGCSCFQYAGPYVRLP